MREGTDGLVKAHAVDTDVSKWWTDEALPRKTTRLKAALMMYSFRPKIQGLVDFC
jgi:hypothetical protein